jgi:hypothetical protein
MSSRKVPDENAANRRNNAWRAAMPAAMAVAATAMLGAMPGDARTFTEALTSGKASANVRLRYENVDDDAFADKAEGLTIRTRLGYETASFHGFTALVEFEDVHALHMDDYQSPAPPVPAATAEAIIADPEQNELNRVQLRYRGISRLDLVLGRQRIMYDNQRFVGNVGFRQDEQTFDAFTAVFSGIPNWTISYAYVDKVNGITPVFDANVNDTFVHVAYNGFSLGRISAYGYLLTNEEKQLTALNPGLRYDNNDTVGIRFDGASVLPATVPLRAIYRAEYAKQSVDRMTTPAAPATPVQVDNDTRYMLAELGIGYTFGDGAYTLVPMIGYEVLGSDDGVYALQTPYATKHAFQGWIDQFLVTPNEGLVDTYLSIGFDLNHHATKILAVYHDYESDKNNVSTGRDVDFGQEWNIQAIRTLGPNWTIGAKYGKYSEGSDTIAGVTKRDARKAWAWVELNF